MPGDKDNWNWESEYFPDDVETKGNSDAKVLAKAFKEYAKNGIVQSDKDIIEKLDDILKGADIIIKKDGSSAVIAQEDGQTFTVKAPAQYSSNPPVKSR